MQEKQLLAEYKKYDVLNQNRERPLIKIFVSYIKPSFLFKSDILTPIHLGRAVERENSKDGVVSDEDIKWLHANCIGDDDFEGNISHVNRRVGFLTGTYWAWKNYKKLDNPDYFGSFGYRRLLKNIELEKIQDYDCIISKPRHISITYEERLIDYLGSDFYTKVINTISSVISSEIKDVLEYLAQNEVYFDEIYIMKKELFFLFCEWIFPIIFKLLEISPDYSINPQKITTKDILIQKNEFRDLAYVAEFLTGYYIKNHVINNNKIFVYADLDVLYKDKKTDMINVLRKRLLKKGLI